MLEKQKKEEEEILINDIKTDILLHNFQEVKWIKSFYWARSLGEGNTHNKIIL